MQISLVLIWIRFRPQICTYLKEAEKKVLVLVDRPLRGGGAAAKGLATKKKDYFEALK